MLITIITVFAIITSWPYLAKRLWRIEFPNIINFPLSVLLQIVLFIGYCILWFYLRRWGFIGI